jgi:antitoxin ParD1/3/4
VARVLAYSRSTRDDPPEKGEIETLNYGYPIKPLNPARNNIVMNISLGQEQQEFIQTQVQAGVYNNPDDLINEAIALLAEKHRKLSELKQMIAIGTEQIQRGEVTDGEVVFDQLQAKYGFAPEPTS